MMRDFNTLHAMSDCKAILFDLDGTLVNSLEDIADACNHTLAESGYPTHPLEEYRHLVGDGQVVLMRRALPDGVFDRLGTDAEELVARYTEAYDARWHHKSRPYEGMPAVLKELAARRIALAVVTNKSEVWAESFVTRFYPGIVFDGIVGNGPNTPCKPDPTGSLRVIQNLGLDVEECCFVGDTRVDIATGKNVGCRTIGCLWGFRTRIELTQAGADVIISHPSELLGLV